MAKLSISRAWDDSKAAMRRDGRLIGSVALALILFPQAVFATIAPPPELSGVETPGWAPLVMLIVALVGLAGQIAIARLAIGPAASVGEAIGHGVRRAPVVFAAVLMFGLALIVLMIPLALVLIGPERLKALSEGSRDPAVVRAILPILLAIIAIAVRFQLTVPVAAMEAAGPIRMLRRSWDLTRGHYWRLLGFLLLVLATALIIQLASQIVGGVVGRLLFGNLDPFSAGALLVALIAAAAQTALSILVTLMLAHIYVQSANPPHGDVSVPSSGT